MNFVLFYAMALFVTYLLFRFINKLLRRSFPGDTNRAFITFGISSVVVILVFSFILGLALTIVFYIPCLIFWLINDIMKFKMQKRFPK